MAKASDGGTYVLCFPYGIRTERVCRINRVVKIPTRHNRRTWHFYYSFLISEMKTSTQPPSEMYHFRYEFSIGNSRVQVCLAPTPIVNCDALLLFPTYWCFFLHFCSDDFSDWVSIKTLFQVKIQFTLFPFLQTRIFIVCPGEWFTYSIVYSIERWKYLSPNVDASPDKEKNWIFVQWWILYTNVYDESLLPAWIGKHKSRNNNNNATVIIIIIVVFMRAYTGVGHMHRVAHSLGA